MKKMKQQKKIENKNNKNTFYAKVDIVKETKNIKYYSYKRDDYTELALTALDNNIEAIRYISPLCKDYPMLCEKSVNESSYNFLYIDETTSNYKELGIKAIADDPRIVLGLDWNNRYYIFFWKWAIAQCYSIISEIDKNRGKLYSVIATALEQEPNAIHFVNSDIPVYNNLCRFAFSKDNETVIHMDLNKVDKKYALEIIKRQPEKIEYLDDSKNFYADACKIAVTLNSNLITKINMYYLIDNKELFSELIDIIKTNNSEGLNESTTLYILFIKNRQKSETILNSIDLTEEKYKLLKDLNDEYRELIKEYDEKKYSETTNSEYEINKISCKRKCPIESINNAKMKLYQKD